MPELPDIVVYVESLARRVVGRPIAAVRVRSPFLVRTVDPPLSAVIGKRVHAVTRMGKRIVLRCEEELALVLHLMVAGRLSWLAPGAAVPARNGLAAFDFENGTLLLTEASTKKRASLHVARGAEALARLDPKGIEPLACDLQAFRAALTRESHTLKRALTDPHVVSGVGNSYSDEILHRAKLSPVALARRLTDEEVARLHDATRAVLNEWSARLREQTGDGFPKKVTAFREGMAVHGRFGLPCPVCGTSVQRIRYAESETNYCPTCQTNGRLLADRALSRLLKDDWPRTLDELERLRDRVRDGGGGGEGRS